MPTTEQIYDQVKDAMIEALGVDDDEVTPEATLVSDLGAESIDFLDIVFRLEKSFDIKIPRGELFPENILTDPQYIEDGKFTEAGLSELRERMPFANLDEFAKDPRREAFQDLFTVETICNYIATKVGT